jgi:hypothetical protein
MKKQSYKLDFKGKNIYWGVDAHLKTPGRMRKTQYNPGASDRLKCRIPKEAFVFNLTVY